MSHLFSMSAPVVRHKRKQDAVVVDDEENDDPGTQDSPVCLEQEETRDNDTITPPSGSEESRQAIAESLLTECEERSFSAMASATIPTVHDLESHKHKIEEYVVACLRARAFGTSDREWADHARADLLSGANTYLLPQPVERFGNIIPAFVDTLTAILLKHQDLLVAYAATFPLQAAPYIDILVIRPCTFVNFQILVLRNRLCSTLPSSLQHRLIMAAALQGTT
jgi:hypothetical protein